MDLTCIYLIYVENAWKITQETVNRVYLQGVEQEVSRGNNNFYFPLRKSVIFILGGLHLFTQESINIFYKSITNN